MIQTSPKNWIHSNNLNFWGRPIRGHPMIVLLGKHFGDMGCPLMGRPYFRHFWMRASTSLRSWGDKESLRNRM
jgi:hypothetical protein